MSVNELSQCATSCFNSLTGTCATQDYQCICSSNGFGSDMNKCLGKDCGFSDLNLEAPIISNICLSYGVSVTISQSSSITTSPPTQHTTTTIGSQSPTSASFGASAGSTGASGSSNTGSSSERHRDGLPKGARIGIIFGVVLLALIVVAGIFVLIQYRKRHRPVEPRIAPTGPSEMGGREVSANAIPHEVSGDQQASRHEVAADQREKENVAELSNDVRRDLYEADSGQFAAHPAAYEIDSRPYVAEMGTGGHETGIR